MSGYFEWQQLGQYKQPYYIRLKEHKLLAVAALWDSWQPPEGDIIHSCCLITTAANSMVARFHDRMPVVLGQEQQHIWLDTEHNDLEILEKLLVPAERDDMIMYPVSPKMNNWRYTHADSIEPINL